MNEEAGPGFGKETLAGGGTENITMHQCQIGGGDFAVTFAVEAPREIEWRPEQELDATPDPIIETLAPLKGIPVYTAAFWSRARIPLFGETIAHGMVILVLAALLWIGIEVTFAVSRYLLE